jgi:uncharacterized protein (TIGR00730 family)
MKSKEFYDEYQKAREKLIKENFPKGLLAFGSARIPYEDSHIQEIKEIAGKCAEYSLKKKKPTSFITGGGPSVMTAWLELPHKKGADTGAMALELPFEKRENQMQHCNLETSFLFKTFQARKAIMMEFAKAIIIFKGGFGTMDELFEAITLIKTGRMSKVPIFIYPQNFYKNVLNFQEFLKAGTIRQDENDLLTFINSKEELVEKLYEVIDREQ